MKTLNSILTQRSDPYFPSIGKDGYGGEQDGSVTILGTFQIGSREQAKKIFLPDFVKLNHARYDAMDGWTGVIGYWSNQDISNENETLLANIDWI